jgi:hypothetical protein
MMRLAAGRPTDEDESDTADGKGAPRASHDTPAG